MDRRLRFNGVVAILSLIICMSIWQIICPDINPNPNTNPILNVFVASPLLSDFYWPPGYTPNGINSTYVYPMNTLNVSDDYSQLMDLKQFSFTIMNRSCNDTYPFLIILIHSAPSNFAKRQIIRETWGQRMENTQLLFMLGAVNNQHLQAELLKENATYGDFVQGTFMDSYRNVTYKHAMVFKYVIYHCPAAKYLLKTDDDVFVNLVSLNDYLRDDVSSYGASNFLLCKPKRYALALRSYRSKWRVSFREYPYKYYPTYCAGWSLVYSQDVIFKIYKGLQVSKYFWIDDVLITGIIFNKLNLTHTETSKFTLEWKEQEQIVNTGNRIEKDFFFLQTELTDNDETRRLWSYCKKYVKGRSRYIIDNNQNT